MLKREGRNSIAVDICHMIGIYVEDVKLQSLRVRLVYGELVKLSLI